jgi:hypothetical protein
VVGVGGGDGADKLKGNALPGITVPATCVGAFGDLGGLERAGLNIKMTKTAHNLTPSSKRLLRALWLSGAFFGSVKANYSELLESARIAKADTLRSAIKQLSRVGLLDHTRGHGRVASEYRLTRRALEVL